ncbi:hypothetical protein ACFVS2_26535 [Brevibacillus sp. NPDC058079]|uniref:hypothetical protein n=1 Tax=Brevibacillus sp. NPDC058079 TaxID=3346330 RepID=UPI0036E68F8A
MKPWIKTDSIQWVREITEDKYCVLDGVKFKDHYYLKEVDVDLSFFSEREIEDEIKGFYDSFESIKDIYGEAWKQIVAEIIAENRALEDDDLTFDSLQQLNDYVVVEFGIDEEND